MGRESERRAADTSLTAEQRSFEVIHALIRYDDGGYPTAVYRVICDYEYEPWLTARADEAIRWYDKQLHEEAFGATTGAPRHGKR